MSVELKCVQEFHENGKLKREEFFNSDGERHNVAGSAARWWHANGQLACEYYYLNGKFHNEAGTTARWWNENGVLAYEEYWLDGRELTKAEWEVKVNPAPCDGKVVVIEGRRYKLVAE
jgi:antitoxin component YwqK of YwqJK toxin-antitoxin module